MVKQPDGIWSVIDEPLVPGLHYYTLIVDGVEMGDTGSRSFFGGSKYASAVEVPEPGATTTRSRTCRTARCARSGTSRR